LISAPYNLFELCRFGQDYKQMNNKLFTIFLTFVSTLNFGQAKIQWDYSYSKEKKAIEIQATLADGWHLYSQHISNEIGPVPTSFLFSENSQIKLIGQVTEPLPIQKYDENFEAMLDFFEGKVLFSQRITTKGSTTIKGSVTYMVCNETMCLPPTEELFSIPINN
jgi:thiol:disulfide interchange protein DsbD